jgi:hypothetical protein
MNALKKYLGIVWMLLGPAGIYYIVATAIEEIGKKPVIDTKIQWGVFVIIFIPISIGMMVFGYFALKNEYDHLPESSAEIEDE